jgi:hypothetical protein
MKGGGNESTAVRYCGCAHVEVPGGRTEEGWTSPGAPGNPAANSRIGRRFGWNVPRHSARRVSAPADGEIEAAVIHAEESKGTDRG